MSGEFFSDKERAEVFESGEWSHISWTFVKSSEESGFDLVGVMDMRGKRIHQTQIVVGHSRFAVWIANDTCVADIAKDTVVSDEIGLVCVDCLGDFFSEEGVSDSACELEVFFSCGIFFSLSADDMDFASV